jgi:serine/threonine protein phosphatase PrpC
MGVVPKRPNKPNQDAYFAIENFMDIGNAYLFGIMDGHGSFGKEASTLVKSILPSHLRDLQNDKDLFLTDPNFRASSIKAAYKKTNEALSSSNIDFLYSGTTSVTAFTCDSLLLCANVGDSRAVIGSLTPESKWRAYQITTDHKPDLKEEYDRILSFNGRVEPYKGK